MKRNLNRNGIALFYCARLGLSMPCVAKTKLTKKREQAPALHTEFPIPHLSDNPTNQDLASQNVATSLLTRNNFRLARDPPRIVKPEKLD